MKDGRMALPRYSIGAAERRINRKHTFAPRWALLLRRSCFQPGAVSCCVWEGAQGLGGARRGFSKFKW